MKLNGYKARLELKKHEAAILNNIKLLPEHKKLDTIKKQCSTYKISTKITDISKKYIIGTLSKLYNDELQEITNGKIEAKLIPAGTKQGVPYSKIVLQLKDSEYSSVYTVGMKIPKLARSLR